MNASSSPTAPPVRVLIVSPCQGIYGGMEAFVLTVAGFLHAQPGFEVRVAWKRVRGFALQPAFAAIVENSPVRSTFVPRLSRALWRLVRWADVVHSQNAPPDVALLARLARRPLALTIHNWNRTRGTLRGWVWRMSGRLARRRWYDSRFVASTWEPRGLRLGSEVIPPVSEFGEGTVSPDERRGFVFAARWIANKGIDTLLAAYRQARLDHVRWPLRLIGDGPLAGEVRRELAAAPIPGVEILGFVDAATKASVIARSRWMVTPPHTNEDFGLTPLEARHFGVPSIVTRDGGVPEAAGSQALVCEPRDAGGLALLLERAAAMNEDEYRARADIAHEELKDFLRPLNFYADAFRELAKR